MTPNVGGPLLDFHRSGRVRILAINADKRLAAASDIPTAIEAGLPGMIAANFNGLFGPAGLPRALVNQVGAATRAMMADPDLQKVLASSGFEPILDSSPEAATRLVADELARWTPVIKATAFKLE
jgi:tripartite-type tricarboxylate transporter receptor subunit TctC